MINKLMFALIKSLVEHGSEFKYVQACPDSHLATARWLLSTKGLANGLIVTPAAVAVYAQLSLDKIQEKNYLHWPSHFDSVNVSVVQRMILIERN